MERADLKAHSQRAFQQTLDATIRIDFLLRELRQEHREAPTAYDREQSGLSLAKLVLAEARMREAIGYLRLLT